MSDSVIELRNLSKFIQGKAIVLRMSLDIPRGSLFGLLGPNGAGKTTTLKLMTGRLKPTSGSVRVLGLDPWKQRVKMFEKVGYLPQNPTQHPDKTVLQFLTYMCQLKGLPRREAILETREILSKVGLAKFEQSIVGKLSGGETQRLGFANALIGEPEILVLDEPTASLDPEGRVYVMDLISKLARDNNQTIVISSHILPEIQRLTNNIAIMSEGKVLVSGNLRQLTSGVFDSEYEIETSHPNELAKELNEAGFEAVVDTETIIVQTNGKLQDLWRTLPSICLEKGFELRSYKPTKDALENVFLQLVSNQAAQELGGKTN